MSGIPDELNKKVTRVLHDQGIELTPDQVREERKMAYAKIREHMKALGYEIQKMISNS